MIQIPHSASSEEDQADRVLAFPPTPSLLGYLVDHRLVVSCPLVNVSNFQKYCENRGLDASRYRLERLERLGILYPLARGRHFVLLEKLSHAPDGRGFVSEGELEPGEQWDGPVNPREWHLTFDAHHRGHLRTYLNEGRLWVPTERDFEPWESMCEGEDGERVESFYSMFQAYTLYFLDKVGADHTTLWADDLATWTAEQRESEGLGLVDWADEAVRQCRAVAARTERVAWLCQVLSNRYFPLTQGDRRTIHVSGWSGLPHGAEEDWYHYVQRWYEDELASKTLADLDLSVEEVGKMLDDIGFQAHASDPLDDWYSFVSFISHAAKERLKGSAQLGQHLWAMEALLRLFYSDLVGEDIPCPHENGPWVKNVYGPAVPDDTFAFLEGLANRFHVNPRPRLVLVVEGDGEEECLPWLIEQLGNASVATLQIEVVNFRGIDNIVGTRRDGGVGLKLLIDYLHRHDTIVCCLLDNESAAQKAVNSLLSASSVLDSGRKVTKPDYIYLWNPNIEFDNFDNTEIAHVLTAVSDGRSEFDASEVAVCREAAEPGAKLKALFLSKTGYDLPKKTLLRLLFDLIIANREKEIGRERHRKVIQAAIDIANYSAWNYPPVNPEIRKKNLASGLFG